MAGAGLHDLMASLQQRSLQLLPCPTTAVLMHSPSPSPPQLSDQHATQPNQQPGDAASAAQQPTAFACCRRIYRRLGRNVFQHAFHAITGQFTESVTKEVYTNVRMLFINRMGFDYDFNFHQFVVNSMEVSRCSVCWACAALW